ncbi:MAG: hypothetical protein J6Y31_04500 [Bacteroidales bacterium]|nr:hypothetical protein [Bacteroidales bacterium]MBP5374159.1 hypothetical protein [Bacteroidales bacterium]
MTKRITSLILGLCLCLSLFAQGRVNTRKYILNDFTDKLTRVVLPGESLIGSTLREEVVNQWTASAFEFCTVEEFERDLSRDDFYFLVLADTRFKGEEAPGLTFLTLFKGTPEAAEDRSKLHEIISLPVCAADGASGRELVYLGAMVEAIQAFTLAAMESELTAYGRDDWFNGNFSREGHTKRIWICEDDLAPQVQDADKEKFLDEDIFIASEDEVDSRFIDGGYNVLTSYVAAPSSAEGYSYQMLFSADSRKLFYIQRHKLGKKKGPGFLPEDLKRIARKR